jgi:hypothetical protein
VGAGSATVTFSHKAEVTSLLNFVLHFTTSGGSGSYAVQIDGDAVDPIGGGGSDFAYSFGLTSGATLNLVVNGFGSSGTPDFSLPGAPPDFTPTIIPGLPGAPGNSEITITNFQSISAVPEPGAWAAACGIFALGFAIWRRRRSSSLVQNVVG